VGLLNEFGANEINSTHCIEFELAVTTPDGDPSSLQDQKKKNEYNLTLPIEIQSVK
jgi:hypothetical protein